MIAGVCLKDNILLLGGSGTLGKAIIKSKLFKKLKYPSKKKLNILNQAKIENFIKKNNINIILHCAALARVKECEKNKKKAFKVNVIGTKNVVNAVLNCSKFSKQKIKILFISSDGVYPSTKGNYKETDKLKSYNYYGLTKIKAEKFVRKLKYFIIIRTRFFDKKKIKFKYSATNIFTSSLEVNKLVNYIYKIQKKNFNGILNIGRNKISDYDNYKKYLKNIKPCDKKEIFSQVNFKLATDASLNLNKLKKIL